MTENQVLTALWTGIYLLIQELDMPFDGVIQISQRPMYNALVHLGH